MFRDDTDLTTLLHDAVADVEPNDRLAEIREAVTDQPSRFGWYAAGGGLLAVAAAVTAIGLVTSGTTPKADDPGPVAEPETHPVAVYYAGDAGSDRARLFREYHQVTGDDDLDAALAEIATPPDDPDYIHWWAPGVLESAAIDGRVIEVEVGPEVLDPSDEAIVLSDLVLQSLIYTLQAAVGERLPVQFVHDGNPVAEVFTQPTSEPLANAPQMDVLNLVQINDPVEGLVVTDSFIAHGAASSFEGNVRWRVLDGAGAMVREGFTTAGAETHLVEWETEPIDVRDLPAGSYTFEARTEGGKPFVDTRTIVVE